VGLLLLFIWRLGNNPFLVTGVVVGAYKYRFLGKKGEKGGQAAVIC
jgi:hypothetical protein